MLLPIDEATSRIKEAMYLDLKPHQLDDVFTSVAETRPNFWNHIPVFGNQIHRICKGEDVQLQIVDLDSQIESVPEDAGGDMAAQNTPTLNAPDRLCHPRGHNSTAHEGSTSTNDMGKTVRSMFSVVCCCC